jgi:hypothetical protein
MVNQKELKMEIARIAEGADMLSVETRADYEALIKHEDTAVAIKKQVEEYWNPPIAKANALHKELTGKRGEMLKPLEAFIAACRKAGGAFLAFEQKREQERLDAIRREAERIRKEQEARQAAEVEALRQKQEAERKAVEEAFKNSPEELAKAKARLEAEQAAQREAQARRAAEMIDTSLVPATAAKVSAGAGRSAVETWTYEVVDESLVPAAYKVLDLSKIKKQVQLTKDKTNIPGIRPYKTVETRRTGGGYGAD